MASARGHDTFDHVRSRLTTFDHVGLRACRVNHISWHLPGDMIVFFAIFGNAVAPYATTTTCATVVCLCSANVRGDDFISEMGTGLLTWRTMKVRVWSMKMSMQSMQFPSPEWCSRHLLYVWASSTLVSLCKFCLRAMLRIALHCNTFAMVSAELP